ncbi:transglycosylase domain-containing protein [Actinomycetospora soli]|uniref:transglycosylase domain-containing protein n=1 Tax=Actinomycetospora soli TaxID=2893887 RepID=UPI001E62D49F|nr:transglycosylase domain-containing protein [Actinomycetospora soli]MCD2191130.1 penicillin-binding protein [Actinomycetospora soli]
MTVRPPARWLGACLLAGVLLAGIALPPVVVGGLLVGRAAASVDATSGSLTGGRVREASVVTDASGTPIARLYERYRLPVGSAGIADTMKAAIVAIEDRRFFVHDGVDWRGLGRALASNALRGSPFEGQGASTITMQYVKNYRLYALADTEADRRAATADTLARKVTEVRLAHRIEARLDKDEILSRYLDLVSFGNGAYGVEAAARTYFGTTAAELSLPQAALLAGIVRSPEGYDPTAHPEAAQARRGEVLRAMADVGSITTERAAAADAAPLGVAAPLRRPAQGCASAVEGTGFFCRYVEEQLAAAGIPPSELRTGGYTVRTTLDPAAQARADAAAGRIGDTSGVANVVAVVSPGAASRPVLALAANRDYGPDADAGQSSLPLVTAALRGAGSVYKIFTAATALERGLVSPDEEIDVPERYTSSISPGYTVENLGSYADRMTLTRALATSPNTAFVELEDRIGSVRPVVEAARALGLRRTLGASAPGGGTVGETVTAQDQASFTLGPNPTSPLELANVGATLVADGRWCPPTPILAVTDREGRPVDLPTPACEQAVPTEVAADLRTALSEDHTDGTSADAAEEVGWDRPMIGKTGTTQVSASSAFLGATTAYAGAVMTFSDRGAPQPVCTDPVRVCSDGDLTGGSVPAETWYRTMLPLHRGVPEDDLLPARDD